jgi:hypothetical protein
MFSLLVVSLDRHRQSGTMERAGAASRSQGVKHDQFNPRRGFEPLAALSH